MCISRCIHLPCGFSFIPSTADTKNGPHFFNFWPPSGCLGDDAVRLRHWGEMSTIKMQSPVGGGCVTGRFTDITCRQKAAGRLFSVLLLLLIFSLVAPALSIHMEAIESHSEFTCEPIRLRMCQDLPYNTTFMPNLLNHYDQQTAAIAMEVGGLCVSHSTWGNWIQLLRM